jgi:hypothetical protein
MPFLTSTPEKPDHVLTLTTDALSAVLEDVQELGHEAVKVVGVAEGGLVKVAVTAKQIADLIERHALELLAGKYQSAQPVTSQAS